MKQKKPVKLLVIGAGGRGNDLSAYALKHPDELKIIGVAEPDKIRRERFAAKFQIDEKFVFNSWQDSLKFSEADKLADAALVATQDRMHTGPAIGFLKKGYHILLEKPMATTPEECIYMTRTAQRYKRIFGICHVLRYTAFYRKIKELVDSGIIGDIATVEHIEAVRYWHFAHSFIRGNWRNSNLSSPLILQKCCHDMDILRWIVGKSCKKVSSFGSLMHFKKQNAPAGSTKRCTGGCKIERKCPYSAIRIYLEDQPAKWLKDITPNPTPKGMRKALEEGPYGRCVYHCDNNVADHQVVALEFDGGITASHTVAAFTADGTGRRTRIMGTQGELTGDNGKIEVNIYDKNKKTMIDPMLNVDPESGHGGGDMGVMHDFVQAVSKNDSSLLSSTIEASLESHLMAFAAEKSRVTGKTITI
ncbi:MAG: hypothetical protein A2297_08900 [Elusimicrobia bacterium RIFOXYB2_FULL_48_7]|nr:MAG: hypothetical protein A2297_08900 [Elusimicrobia bacterium RIFOXYB2_FULL_48_7]